MTPAFRHLHEKWSHKEKSRKERLIQKHQEAFLWLQQNATHAVVGSISSLLLFMLPFTHPSASSSAVKAVAENSQPYQPLDPTAFLIGDLSRIMPTHVQPLDKNTEKQVASMLARTFQLDVRPDINGLRLDRTYGYIGAEQHLARYPGDTMGTHFDNEDDSNAYYSSGMAPGLGAWGYFADSASSMTQEEMDREKWYIAVQTFMASDFQNRFSEYRDFFKYRKMLVVNPQNGRAVVADIGDSGPAVWTGKQLGGSPEVMRYLQRVDGAQKGGVLFYFINDPKDEVPLGPLQPAKDLATVALK